MYSRANDRNQFDTQRIASSFCSAKFIEADGRLGDVLVIKL
jgi:hypothetical protein